MKRHADSNTSLNRLYIPRLSVLLGKQNANSLTYFAEKTDRPTVRETRIKTKTKTWHFNLVFVQLQESSLKNEKKAK